MAKQLKTLLSDLQGVVEQISAENGKQEGQPVEGQPTESETSTHEPDTPATPSTNPDEEKISEASDLIVKAGQAAALVIGVDKNETMRAERVEVTPEPDGRVSIMIRAKKEEQR